MRSSLVALQLLLACVLVWATSVPEENKECCGPGVPPEKSCCPKDNSTLQEAGETPESNLEGRETQEEAPAAAGASMVGPGKLWQKLYVPTEPTSEELEEDGKRYRQRMQNNPNPYESKFLKERALRYFNKRSSNAYYRPLEDLGIKVTKALGTMLNFTIFLVNTNCTKEEGRRFVIPQYERSSKKVDSCVPLPKHEQKRFECRVFMFLDPHHYEAAVVGHRCKPVVFWKESDDNVDLSHLTDFFDDHFGSSF